MDEDKPLADELGVKDLRNLIFGKRGRLFSAAGRESPIAEFSKDFVILHPPDKPFIDSNEGEEIVIHVSDRGVLLDELGQEKKIPGGKFRGKGIWWLAETIADTTRHWAGWFDDEGKAHKLFVSGDPMSTDAAFKLRNRTHDGEISIFPEVHSEGEDPPPLE